MQRRSHFLHWSLRRKDFHSDPGPAYQSEFRRPELPEIHRALFPSTFRPGGATTRRLARRSDPGIRHCHQTKLRRTSCRICPSSSPHRERPQLYGVGENRKEWASPPFFLRASVASVVKTLVPPVRLSTR